MASSRLERIGTIFTRQRSNELMLKNLSEVLDQHDADYNVLKENEQKLEQLTGAFLKCFQQASAAHKQKLKSLREIHNTFKTECEEMNARHKAQSEKLAEELDKDLKTLEQKLVSETKRSGWETLRKTIFHAMQNDLVEGLITRGAIKPDERPLWFDIYKAFPPVTEPKFARPQPEIKSIRQILYQEDVIRAKFHSAGHGMGTVNMLSPTGETHIKKLVKQYEKLKAEGVPESELVGKSAAAVDSHRQSDAPPVKNIPKNPESATAQVLAEADLKNIFNENVNDPK